MEALFDYIAKGIIVAALGFVGFVLKNGYSRLKVIEESKITNIEKETKDQDTRINTLEASKGENELRIKRIEDNDSDQLKRIDKISYRLQKTEGDLMNKITEIKGIIDLNANEIKHIGEALIDIKNALRYIDKRKEG